MKKTFTSKKEFNDFLKINKNLRIVKLDVVLMEFYHTEGLTYLENLGYIKKQNNPKL